MFILNVNNKNNLMEQQRKAYGKHACLVMPVLRNPKEQGLLQENLKTNI